MQSLKTKLCIVLSSSSLEGQIIAPPLVTLLYLSLLSVWEWANATDKIIWNTNIHTWNCKIRSRVMRLLYCRPIVVTLTE